MVNALIFSNQSDTEPSPTHRAFNRLVKKLDKMRLENDEVSLLLNRCLHIYGQEVYPVELNIVALRREKIEIIYHYYTDKKFFKKNQKDGALEVMETQLRDIMELSAEPLDGTLLQIFETVYGTSLIEMQRKQIEVAKSAILERHARMGIEIDLSQFTPDMSPEEIMARLARLKEETEHDQRHRQTKAKGKKSSKKQPLKEIDEKRLGDLKSKNLSALYRQLARLFHPDLEQDTQVKSKKEVLMKELTAAYEKRDLYTLLRLEIEWLGKDESNLSNVSKDKLEIYKQILKEQINQLESEKDAILHHPRYKPIFRACGGMLHPKSIDLNMAKIHLQDEAKELAKELRELKSKQGHEVVREMARIAGQQRKHMKMLQSGFFD